MKVYGFNGMKYQWPPNGYTVNGLQTRQRSSLHLRARNLLRRLFPLHIILEEVPVPGDCLYCDFVIPTLNLIVEVHGAQHYQYSPMFHSNRWDFVKGQDNDERKQEWAELNSIRFCVLPYNEDDDSWEQRLRNL